MTICHQKIETHEENQYVHVYQTVYLSTSVSTVVTPHVYPLHTHYKSLFYNDNYLNNNIKIKL